MIRFDDESANGIRRPKLLPKVESEARHVLLIGTAL